jgi:phage-related protein
MALDMTAAVKIQASVDGIASINGLEKSLDRVDRQASGLQGTFGRLKSSAGGVAGSLSGLVPAIGIASIVALGKRSIDAADNLNDLRQRTGVAVEILDKFGKAANDSGSSLEEVAKSMGKLAKGIVDPASKTNEALNSIGISSIDAQGKIRGVDSIMLDLADKFSKMPDGAEKTALAMNLFGKSGANIIPMLNAGKEALNEYTATIDKDMAASADKFNDSINKVMSSISGPFNQAISALLPTITKLAEVIANAAIAFSELPESMQTVIIGVAGLATAFNILAPAINAIIGIFTALKGLAIIAAGIFTGPVGWAALLIAAGVAIYAFRDQIGAAINFIIELFKQFITWCYANFIKPFIDAFASIAKYIRDQIGAAINFIIELFKQFITWYYANFIKPFIDAFALIAKYISENFIEPTKKLFTTITVFIDNNFVKPVQNTINNMIKNISGAFQSVKDFITKPFEIAMQTIRGIVNGILNGINNAISNVINAINKIIQGANQALARLNLPQIPYLPIPQLPKFAKGAVVNGPTIAMVGEGGQREYIIPESKMAGASANYMAGARGSAVIPAFANGGIVGRSNSSNKSFTATRIKPQVNIQTGPIIQMNNTNYVTTQDLGRAVQSSIQQTLKILRNDINIRNQMGIA